MNGLAWKDFNIFYLGNLFNIFLSILLITGVLIIYYFKKDFKNLDKYILLILAVSFLLPLILVFIIEQFKITFPDDYIFNYPVQKVYIAFLFVISESIQIFSLFVIWLMIYSYKEFSLLNSLFYSVASIILLVLFSFFYTTGGVTNFEEINRNGKYV